MSEFANGDRRRAPQEPAPQVNIWLVAALLVTVAVMMVRNAGLFPRSLHNPLAEPRPIMPRGDLAADEQSTIDIFQSASPSVVHITTVTEGYVRRGVVLTPLEIPEGTGCSAV